MTVANQTNRTSAVGSAAIGQEIPFSFPITITSDLLVKKRITATGVETTLLETTNYTVEISGDIGGTVTTVTAIATTATIHVIRKTPRTQSLDLVIGGSFNAENIETALDKSTKLIIENHDQITNKAITFPETDPSLTTKLPSAINRASKYLTFDASGNVTATTEVPAGSVSFSTFGTNLAEAANALAGKVVMNLDHLFDVRDYGAVVDGATDESTAIQATIDACATAGGGIVYFPQGTYIIDATLVLPSLVHLVGQGMYITILKLKDSADVTVIKSTDFDTLKDSGAITVASGCNYKFGLHQLSIDGNRDNNTSGYGTQLYGKHYIVRDVYIYECADDGFYSEAGAGAAGTGNTIDTIEAVIGPLWVKHCGGNGITMRGPHDSYFDQIFTWLNDGIGFISQESADYAGGGEMGYLHSYANAGFGVRLESGLHAAHIETEANYSGGIYIDKTCTIGLLQCYKNNRDSGDVDTNAQVVVNDGDAVISTLSCSVFTYLPTGLIVNGGKVIINQVYMEGDATAATGIKLDTDYNTINSGYVANFSDTGGVGLETCVGATRKGNNISLLIRNCKTAWVNSAIGVLNRYKIISHLTDASYAHFSGSNIGVNERLDFMGYLNGAYNFTLQQNLGTLANDATPSIANSSKGIWQTGGTTTITDFDDGVTGQVITILCKHSLTFDFTTAQDADHNLDGSSANITADTGDVLKFLCENGTTWHLISNNDASVDNN